MSMIRNPYLKTAVFILFLSQQPAAAQGIYVPAGSGSKAPGFDGLLNMTASDIAVPGPAALPAPAPSAAEPQPPAGNTMPTGQKWGYLVLAYHTICAQLAEYGILPRSSAPGFDEISRVALETVKSSRYAPRAAGQGSLLKDEGFIKELETITGSAFSSAGTVEFLVDGPAAFAVKDRLIKEAKKSIYIATYAIYDDVTGNETMNMLLARKKEGVDIKMVVDNKMAYIFGGRQLKTLAQAGIEILRYADAGKPHNYMHVKMLIVDGAYAVIGGMNYGDVYSHKGQSLKWRDTDVLYTGPAVAESMKEFAAIWKTGSGKWPKMIPEQNAVSGGAARIAVIRQDPPLAAPPILISILKGLYGATKRVNIENAYIVAIPAVTEAIADAAARGVEVNILTNSKESIDSDGKPMAEVILGSAKVFAASGANVWLKQGQTLHSKFMTVDGVFCNIGSYNLHPRSERYDMELNINVLDPASVARLDAAFAADIAAAKKVTVNELEPHKPGWLSRIVEKYFFSQLSPRQL